MLVFMGRDKRCALYQGESKHTLGTTDTHEMYLDPLAQECSKVSPGNQPFDPNRTAPYKIRIGVRSWGKRYMETMYYGSCRSIFQINGSSHRHGHLLTEF